MRVVVGAEELSGLAKLRLVDARPSGFEKEHLEGARHAHLDRDLAAVPADPARGGRHPLPTPEAFAALLGRLGLDDDATVVVYDDAGGANAAARLVWMLRAVGHEKSFLLDGGFARAREVWPLESGPVPDLNARIAPRPFTRPLATIDELHAPKLIDVRSHARYRGDEEPFDPVAGHIPGAINVPYANNLASDGRFASPEALRALYGPILGDTPIEQVVLSCGSGVTACHTLLALEHAGLGLARLYVGSFSEWCRNREVHKGDAP